MLGIPLQDTAPLAVPGVAVAVDQAVMTTVFSHTGVP